MGLLRKRSDKRITLEQKSGFVPDLRGAYLQRANFEHTRLDRAVFANADLSYANLNGVSPKKAILRGTRLSGVMLDEADLAGATRAGAGADLSGAIIGNTNLSGTRFSDPDSERGCTVSPKINLMRLVPAATILPSWQAQLMPRPAAL